MRKILTFIIFAFIISLFAPQLAAEQPAVFTIEAPAGSLQVDEEFSLTVFLEPGDEPIDAFIIYNLTWSADCFDIISVEPGWWDWLFDGGKIGEDYIKWTQAGEKTKASEKQIACVFNCIAEKEGNSEITIDMAQAISGGPEVPVTWESTSVEVEGTDEPEDPPNNNNPSGGGGGGSIPPDEEEPETDQRDETIITEGEFIFSSDQEPEEEPTDDEPEEPVNTTISSEQNETQEEEDEEEIPIPLPEIIVAVGGLIGAVLIVSFIITKRKRTKKEPSKGEPDEEEIIIGK